MDAPLRKRAAASLLSFLLAVGCSDPAGSEVCAGAGATALERNRCLVFEDGGVLSAYHMTIVERVQQTLPQIDLLLDVSDVRIRVTPGPAYIIPEIGLGGRTNGTNEIHLTVDPDNAALITSLANELPPLLAHEMHHVARHRADGFSTNLLEAMVMEGLADHFSIEAGRPDPPLWATALDVAELDHWLAQASAVWLGASYDHDAWFFGSNPAIPRWAGYALGFELVRRYLLANPGARASQLTAIPASAFIPPAAGGATSDDARTATPRLRVTPPAGEWN